MASKQRQAALDIIERADGIVFEGDIVRAWLKQLHRRAKITLDAMKRTNDEALRGEKSDEVKELKKALAGLEKAEKNLKMFQDAVAKRGG